MTIHLAFCVVENENLSSVVAYANNEFAHANFASCEKTVDAFAFGVIDMMLKYLLYCRGFAQKSFQIAAEGRIFILPN